MKNKNSEMLMKVVNNPRTSIICFLAALIVDSAFRSVGLSFLCIPVVALLVVTALISLILIFWNIDNRKRIFAGASCIFLLMIFMVEMVDAVELSQPDHSHVHTKTVPNHGTSGGSGYYPEGDYYPEEDYGPDDDDCAVCHGTNECTNCSGNGGFTCSGCWSTGDCKYCHGSGVNRSYGVEGKCGACNGDGECDLCDGKGIRECRICYGKGRCKYC